MVVMNTQLLVTLASSFRYDKEKVDAEVATIEAAMLREAIKKKQLDHDHVLYILGTRSIYQLRATFAAYKQSYGNTIDKVKNKIIVWSFMGLSFHFLVTCFILCCLDRMLMNVRETVI